MRTGDLREKRRMQEHATRTWPFQLRHWTFTAQENKRILAVLEDPLARKQAGIFGHQGRQNVRMKSYRE